MIYLSFFQSVSCRATLRKSLTSSKINKIQYTLYMLFSALVDKRVNLISKVRYNSNTAHEKTNNQNIYCLKPLDDRNRGH